MNQLQLYPVASFTEDAPFRRVWSSSPVDEEDIIPTTVLNQPRHLFKHSVYTKAHLLADPFTFAPLGKGERIVALKCMPGSARKKGNPEPFNPIPNYYRDQHQHIQLCPSQLK